MVESTFQLARGVGPLRERKLWQSGVARWRDLSSATLPPAMRCALTMAVDDAQSAFSRGDVDRLATLIPSREHWRLFAAFGDDAAYLDIETSDDVVGRAGISAIGILARDGPRLLLAGRDLEDFPDVARDWKMLVTFNGLSFDVPILRAAFPAWAPPACHVDLRHLFARLGYDGGLKAIERALTRLNLRRPPHLDGLDGFAASGLFRRGCDGDRRAMRWFAEYNLYDAINLRTLMAWAFNAMVARETDVAPALRATASTVPVPARGDVLYDVSKILLQL